MNIARMSVQASVIMEKDINISQFPKLVNRLEGSVLITRETSQIVMLPPLTAPSRTILETWVYSGVIMDKPNVLVAH